MSLNFNLSKEIEPGHDFYRYVNDDWMKKNKIPSDFQRWSVFNQLNEDNRDKVKDLLDSLSYSDNNELNSLKILYDQGLNDLENINSISPGEQAKKYIDYYLNCKTKVELLNLPICNHNRSRSCSCNCNYIYIRNYSYMHIRNHIYLLLQVH